MNVHELQKFLENLYRVQALPKVEDFLVSASELKKVLPDVDERPQVLFHQGEEGISLAVHFGDEIQDRIEERGLGELPFSDFLSVAEEVSHYIYLTWSASNERSVTMLDVELQGEIDKFILGSIFFTEESHLFPRMFEEFEYEPNLDATRQKRYEKANRLGGKFCRSLGDWLTRHGITVATLTRLREFYRLNTNMRIMQVMSL